MKRSMYRIYNDDDHDMIYDYRSVNFLPNPHKVHPIARPLYGV